METAAVNILGKQHPYDPNKKLSEQIQEGDVIQLYATVENQSEIKDFLNKVEFEHKISLLPKVEFQVKNNNTIIGAKAGKTLSKIARQVVLAWALHYLVYSTNIIDKKFQEVIDATQIT